MRDLHGICVRIRKKKKRKKAGRKEYVPINTGVAEDMYERGGTAGADMVRYPANDADIMGGKSMIGLNGRNVTILDPELKRRERDNRAYMLRLTRENLMRNYLLEAGLSGDAELPEGMHGGWESPTCALRGHFPGHYLSASAMIWHAYDDPEIKGKADAMVQDLARCQAEHGDGWAGSIPEKYLDWIARGKEVWAPHYTVHKTLMGLVDMAKLAGSCQALEVADRWGAWFEAWTSRFSREEMDDILDVETGGMLEVWADMLEMTGKERYRILLERYTRSRLFDPLLAGEDPLSNMHANTTIPEILGAARAYEVTGDETWKRIVEAYWRCAVTERGYFATGGQTDGEIWTPKRSMGARLGRKNQEHCTVYNMMRLADVLFRWTGDPVYADYIERNLYNGILAQGYYRWRPTNGYRPGHPTTGLVSYFMPMQGGYTKGWGTETTNFYCCHGTLVQANAAHNRYIYYLEGRDVYVCQFFDSDVTLDVDGQKVVLHQRIDRQTGYFQASSDSAEKHRIGEVTSRVLHHPECLQVHFTVETETPCALRLHVRMPEWASGKPSCFVSPERETWENGDGWNVNLPMRIWCEALSGDNGRVAFLYGPRVLAGLVDSERTLHVDPEKPETALERANEREWGYWTEEFQTVTEEKAIRFIPLHDVGYEPYAVYFRLPGKPRA